MAMGSRSSAAELHPAWARWLLPSVGDLLFGAVLGVLVFTALSTRLLGDAGIGWHIRTGQLILATHAVPRVDPFSSSMAGHPWFAWEWLYDVAVGWLERIAGLNGVVLFTAVIISGVFAWTFGLMVRRGTDVLLALILVLLAASASMIHFLARPHVVSWLFTLLWFWILDSSEESGLNNLCARDFELNLKGARAWKIWLLPLSMLVWVNVHGGFLLGFVLLAIYWAGTAWRWLTLVLTLTEDRFEDVLRKIRAGRRLRLLSFAGILSAAATLVNPYGFHLHIHIYHYLSNRFLMDHIDEFQSPNFHYVAQKCLAGLLLLTLVALAVKRRERSEAGITQGLVVLFAVYSGLYASRNIPVSALLLILVIGPWLSSALDRLAQSRWIAVLGRKAASATFLERMRKIELSLRGHVWPVAAIAISGGIAAHGGNLGGRQLMDAHFDSKRFPAAAVNYVMEKELPGPLLSPDYWGGYLIYRLYPRVRIAIDDRHDFYGEDFLKSYLRMVHVEPGWEGFLQQHQVQCVVAPKDSALANILGETDGWDARYEDNLAVIFVRAK